MKFFKIPKINLKFKSAKEFDESGIDGNESSTVVVNGKSFIVKSSSSISILNCKIKVNGEELTSLESVDSKQITVIINGDVNSIDCAGSVSVHGDVKGSIDCNGSVTCGNISGDVECNGDCTVKGDVGGAIDCNGEFTHELKQD